MNNSRRLAILLSIVLGMLVGCGTSPKKTNAPSLQHTEQVTIDQKHTELMQRAIALMEKNDITAAEGYLHQVVSSYPGFAPALNNLALINYQRSRFSDAKRYIDQVLSFNSPAPNTFNLAGLIAVETGEYKMAQGYYEQALQKSPSFANAHYNLALLYDMYFQNLPKAIQHYEFYVAAIPTVDEATQQWIEELKRNVK